MKRLLLFIIISFMVLIPNVSAKTDVEIKSISVNEKSESADVTSDAKFKGLDITFNLKFSNVGDYVIYKVDLQNNSDKDFIIDKHILSNSSDYVKYSYTYDNSDKIKPNSSKNIYIKAKYIKEIPATSLINNKYRDTQTISIASIKDESSTIVQNSNSKNKRNIENPKTSSNLFLVFAIGLVIVSSIVLLIEKSRVANIISIVVLGFLIIPTVQAFSALSFEITSNIEIDNSYAVYSYNTTVNNVTNISDLNNNFTEDYNTLSKTNPVFIKYKFNADGTYMSKSTCLVTDEGLSCLGLDNIEEDKKKIINKGFNCTNTEIKTTCSIAKDNFTYKFLYTNDKKKVMSSLSDNLNSITCEVSTLSNTSGDKCIVKRVN